MDSGKTIREALFLLGGHDLEMQVIRETLEREGLAYSDHGLSWKNALLSSYSEEIAEAERNGQDIYGIELRLGDKEREPAGYHVIDHHNDMSGKASSIEQVYELLGLEMDERAKIVAANDKGYIQGMMEMGLTQEEAMAIRQEDRAAQGVTDDDERQAEEAIKGKRSMGILTVVRSATSRFSAVTDKLWPYRRLLVYTDKELMYSGERASWVYKVLKGRNKEAAYCGGGDNGYAGIALPDRPDTIKSVAKEIITLMSTYSYHIFYFPFEWNWSDPDKKTYSEQENKKTFSEQIDLKQIDEKKVGEEKCPWKRTKGEPTDEKEQKDLFNEKQYFFPFVHYIMYDDKDKKSLMRHFEREEPKKNGVEYVIKIKDRQEPYRLKVESMNLNLYSTGVGVLSFFLINDETNKKEDILKINQYGRRIMLPFYDDKNLRNETAESIKITRLDSNADAKDRYTETFDTSTSDTWNAAKFIRNLIEDLDAGIDVKKIHPIIDDRMLVNCWYGNNELANEIKDEKGEKKDGMKFITGDYWYKYVFVDGKYETCQNDEMKKELLEESTYKRWQKYGTLYGLTRYSMVALTDESEFSCDVLAKHMRTMYSRMFELVMVQRASILRFSSEVTKVSKLKSERSDKSRLLAKCMESLYREYISFANQVYFPYVTAQDQGIEMYNILMKQFDSKDKVKDLDSEIDELYQFITLRNEREQNEYAFNLNIIATILLPVTVVAGIFGMNKWEEICWPAGLTWCIIVSVLVCIWQRKNIIKFIRNEIKKQ